ncbi:MAG: AAA family ATPase [Prevotellaceae bacterium]|jgi:exodeoxyribonuclease-5|nr:AAA family ATPase [Prevotellaceae bacterium]
MDTELIVNLIENKLKFIPVSDQKKLIRSLAQFILDANMPIFLLKGYAGTGKTSVIAALVRSLRELRINTVLMAPTGRAAKVLASYSELQAFTVHKKIYRQKSMEEQSVFSLAPNMYKNTVFIVDEASMISGNSYEQSIFGSGNLLEDMMTYIRNGTKCKVIIVGDSAQLPPVGFNLSPALDINRLERYGNCMDMELKEVVRQANESGILFNATEIRKQIEANDVRFPKFRTDFPDITSITGTDLIETLSDAYAKYGQEETIVICRSNKRANKYNEGIRNRVFFMEDEIVSGDRIMVVKNNYRLSKDMEEIDFIANGDMATVRRIKKYQQRYGLHFADIILEFPDYNNLEIENKAILDTLSIESASLPAEMNQQLFYSLAEDYAHITNKRQRYTAIKEDPFFNALQIKFAYAVTCHKSQGGQWECVFLDCPYFADDNLTFEDLRWFYTAITRASKQLYLVNFDEKYFRQIDKNN